MPKLIKTETILHPAAVRGPRIERVDHYEFEGQITRVEFWYENGRLVAMK